jgi:membrane peptidoglycan carboxypeptidase
MTIEQAASLAASLPFPLKSNPGYHPGRLRWRRDLVLRRMRGEPVRIPTDSDSVDVKSPAPDSAVSVPEIPPP